MRKQLLALPILAFFLFAITSCEKDKEETPQKTNTELLTLAPWKFQSATAMGQDASGFIDDCYEDNIITANADGTGTVDESTSVCVPSNAGPFTWTFENSETEIEISAVLIPGGSSRFNIVTLNETTLVVTQNMTLGPFNTLVTLTFIH